MMSVEATEFEKLADFCSLKKSCWLYVRTKKSMLSFTGPLGLFHNQILIVVDKLQTRVTCFAQNYIQPSYVFRYDRYS